MATAQESLYYTGIQSFNFDKDIVSAILSKPLPPEAMKGMVHPFLKVEENRSWSLTTIFAEQNITEEQPDRDDGSFVEAAEFENDHTYRIWLAGKYRDLMEKFMTAYDNGAGDSLKEFMIYLKKNNDPLLEKRYFYSFWLLMHQRAPIFEEESDHQKGQTLLGDVLNLLGKKQLMITETSEILQYHPRYSIQNMLITVEEGQH